jgi:hypothetical protein
MKNTIIAFSFVAVTAAYGATSVGVSNFKFPPSADNGLAIVDSAGDPLTNVNFGVGSFSGALDAGSLPDDVRNGFTELGTGVTTAAGGSAFFSSANTTADVASSPQDDSSIYVVFYDGADLATAADFIVFEGNSNFETEDAILGANLTVNLIDSTLLYGINVSDINNNESFPNNLFTNGVTFGAAIPEPSSALLSILGLAFVVRRRR